MRRLCFFAEHTCEAHNAILFCYHVAHMKKIVLEEIISRRSTRMALTASSASSPRRPPPSRVLCLASAEPVEREAAPTGRLEVTICLYFKDNRRRDWDNWHKLSMDALQGIVFT